MSIVERATKRLEELNRAGVAVPWAAAGLADSALRASVESSRPAVAVPGSAAEMRLVDADRLAAATSPAARPLAPRRPRPQPKTVTLDLEKLERAGHLVPAQARSQISEEFRQIKRPLLRNARDKDAVKNRLSLIMITSALPGEGKTFSAINLAMSIAIEIDVSVLLIDADVVRPGAMRTLGVDVEQGLLDLLTDASLSLEDVVLQTNVPNVSLLPAGRRNNLSTELLASEAMERLLVSLATDYPGQIVVFDAPPLLLTSEAKVLATRVGQVVLVVEAARTPRSVVEQAFAAVEQCPVVMSVLNKANEPEVRGGYGYYGG